MAILLLRSHGLIAEVNNFTAGITRVWLAGKEMELDRVSEALIQFFEKNNFQYWALEKFLDRAAKLEIVSGFVKFRERLGFPEKTQILSLDDVIRELNHSTLPGVAVKFLDGYDLEVRDLAIFAEYFLTMTDLMSRLDPRLKLWEFLKNLAAKRPKYP